MPYSGPDRLELLLLITKYNKYHPADKIKPQLTETLNYHDANMVEEYLAGQIYLRTQYPYNDFQKQARKLKPLLEEVMKLTHFASYEGLKWLDLLVAVNDMLKQVRSKRAETDKISKERQQEKLKAKQDLAAQKARNAPKKKAEESTAATKDNEAKEETVLQNDQRSNKLRKKPKPLVFPAENIKPKEQIVDKPEKRTASPANPAPTVPPADPLNHEALKDVGIMPSAGRDSQLQCPPKDQQVPGQLSKPTPALPPRKDSPTQVPEKPPTPPIRPALVARSRGKDDPRKRVSFDGPGQKDPATPVKEEDTAMTGINTQPMPGAWQEPASPLSMPAINPETFP